MDVDSFDNPDVTSGPLRVQPEQSPALIKSEDCRRVDSRSNTYHKVKDIIFFGSIIVDIGILLFLILSGLSYRLRDFSVGLSSHFVISNGLYILFLSLGMSLIHFPINFFEGFIWEYRFNLSNQTFKGWLKDEFKKQSLSLLLLVFVIEVIYIFLRLFPQHWWIGAGIFWLLVALILARIMPNVIIPIFYKYSPIQNEELRQKILALFKACQVAIQDAYLINFSEKTKKANAFICGLGKTRRVVLSDTLVQQFSILEIETVVAHELGHYKNRDILKLTVMNFFIIFIGFYLLDYILRFALLKLNLARIDDIAFFPILALGLIVFSFLTMPIVNWYSRFLEKKADLFSLQLTQRPKEFISMLKKLTEVNLGEYDVGWFKENWLYDHPPTPKRIQMAEQFKASEVL